MILLLWLEQLYLWGLQREHADPKQEDHSQSEDEEMPQASYPKGEDTCSVSLS